jgi:hypothetical protein
MYITITIEADEKRFDLNIDGRQTLSAAYTILSDRGLTGGSATAMYKSTLRDEWIPADIPLTEAGIVSGDLLTAQK